METINQLNQISHRSIRITIWHSMIFIYLYLILNSLAIFLDLPLIRPMLGLLTLLFIPGFLIIIVFDFHFENIWEYLVVSLGLSIIFLLIIGFFLNQIFVALGIPKPLNTINIVIVVMLFCGLMAILNTTIRYRQSRKVYKLSPILLESNTVLPAILPLIVILPIISTKGAIILNHGGSNLIAILSLVLISIFFLVVSWNHKKFSSDVLAFLVFIIGLAMLLSFSMRSQHISGWDINQEFFIFQLTKNNQVWKIDSFRDPYNACLSITILPTMISSFLGANDEYVFKAVYQFIFAFVPLIMFLISKKHVSTIFAFLASMFFIFQPWFIQPAPALARQEIGLLFFVLLVWVTFNSRIDIGRKIFLQIFFGAGMVISHYSTAYVGIAFFTITYLISFMLLQVATFLKKPEFIKNRYLSFYTVVMLFVISIYWSGVQTQTSGNVFYVFQITLQTMKNSIISDFRSEDVRLSLFNVNERFSAKDVINYVQAQNDRFVNESDLYPENVYKNYYPDIVRSKELIGVVQNPLARSILSDFLFAIKQITKFLLVLGATLWIASFLKTRRKESDFIILNWVSLLVLFIFIFLPVLSLYYNLFRIYLQTLIISSISLVICTSFLMPKLNEKFKVRIIAIILVLFFFYTNGLSSYIIGGPASMNLNNFGEVYDKFYTHSHEISAAYYLSEINSPTSRIYADETAALRLISFGGGIVEVETAILPSTITTGSYVYLGYDDVRLGITEATHEGKQLTYKYPIDFLEENKSLIYDNGGAKIYR